MQRPIIDIICEAILFGDFSKFDELTKTRPAEASCIRLMLSTDNPGGIKLYFDTNEMQKECAAITPLFEHDRFIFISPETAIQSQLNNGRSNILVDWSFSFDSNFAGRIYDIFLGRNISDHEKKVIYSFILLKKKYSIQTDIIPLIIENTRLRRESPDNNRPRDTIAAFKALDYLDWNKLDLQRDLPLREVLLKSWQDITIEAESDIQDFMKDKTIKEFEKKAIFSNCILLKTACIYLTNPKDSSKNFSTIIDFCICELGKLPSFELNLVWQFLFSKRKPTFWGPITGKSKNIIREIKGMSWDLIHLRSFETMATKSELGSFYIPHFVTFDRRLRELVLENPISFILMDKANQSVLTIRKNELEFQQALNKHIPDDLKNLMTPEKITERRKKIITNDVLIDLADNLESDLKKLL